MTARGDRGFSPKSRILKLVLPILFKSKTIRYHRDSIHPLQFFLKYQHKNIISSFFIFFLTSLKIFTIKGRNWYDQSVLTRILGYDWADENVTVRVTNCDPVFIPPVFFNLKISRL
ncbi:MAG: hypothetical protein DRI57_00845 [Deltaproteobacteria bacterium]|nr:MAG: hypothetical protein DRI57_00845 [Deltaproteobacteria bacterium]